LQTHYKTQLNFTFTGLEAVKGSLQRLQDFIQRLHEINDPINHGMIDPTLERAYSAFSSSLADDLNISAAFAALFELVREVNGLSDAKKVGKNEAEKVIQLLKHFNEVLGVLSFDKSIETIPAELEEALAKRIEARQQKNWGLADELRNFISNRGYIIEDTPQGARLKKGS
jgi:cysteinyl-tRNA synthetase